MVNAHDCCALTIKDRLKKLFLLQRRFSQGAHELTALLIKKNTGLGGMEVHRYSRLAGSGSRRGRCVEAIGRVWRGEKKARGYRSPRRLTKPASAALRARSHN